MEQQVLVFGEPVVQLPKDLFIPPDALRVLLETFSGPLDVLVYLIRKQNFDVLDIPVALITEQYLAYLEVMEQLDMALAAGVCAGGIFSLSRQPAMATKNSR